MECINKENNLYLMNLEELTYGTLEKLNQPNDLKIGQLLMFYDSEKDMICIINNRYALETLDVIEKALKHTSSELEKKIPSFKTEIYKSIGNVILGVLKRREDMEKEHKGEIEDLPKNPNCRFIAIDDEVIQINKIISIKKYSDTFIDIFTTGGKKASIRKVYPNSLIRDYELDKLKKLILETA